MATSTSKGPDAAKLRLLRNQRRSCRKQMEELMTKTTSLLQEDPTPIDALQGNLSSFDYLMSLAQNLDHDILPTIESDEAVETHFKESNDMFQDIRIHTAQIRRTLASVESTNGSSRRNSTDTAIHTPIAAPFHPPRQFPKLPQLELPRFSGDPLQWTTFWDSFESAIHISSMPAVDKFNYLKSLLKGIAADAILGISVSNTTYDTAITIIHQRFGQKQLIINAHVESLVNIPKAVSNTSNLRKLYDSMEIHIRGLESLGITAAAYGVILIPILLSKLPSEQRLIITRKHGSAVGDLVVLRELLKSEIEAREISEVASQSQQQPQGISEFSTGALLLNTRNDWCAFCKGKSHSTFACRTFSTPAARKAKIAEERRCQNCLRQGHNTSTCSSTQCCRRCGYRHHTSLCSRPAELLSHAHPRPYPPPRPHQPSFNRQPPHSTRHSTHTNVISNYDNLAHHTAPDTSSFSSTPALLSTSGTILMQTALTKVTDRNGTTHIVRLLFDTGSQRSYISSHAAQFLGLKPTSSETLAITPFGQNHTATKTYNVTSVLCCSLFNSSSYDISSIIVPTITHPVSRSPFPYELNSIISSFHLADPPSTTTDSLEIDILVGLDYYWDIVKDEVIRVPKTNLTAVPSAFGYLLSGKLHSQHSTSSFNALCVGLCTPNSEDFLKQFWESESFDVSDVHILNSLEKDPVLLQFENTISKQADRYEVWLPWKQEIPDLPSNYDLAHDRFQGLVKRLKKKNITSNYNKIIQQQIDCKFIEPVDPTSHPIGVLHYIAHHPVIKLDRTTTKVRIVYDASAKLTSSHNCLNDCLHPGPNLLNDIHRLLLEFRTFRIVLLADIEKAFLQVALSIQDRDATRFFWLKDINLPPEGDNIQIFRFCRVPFGATSSPFLLAATLRHHLDNSSDPILKSLASQFYVDNLSVGVSSVAKAKHLYATAKQCLREAGMNLREWTSNSKEFTDSLPTEDKAKGIITKVLGVPWSKEKDNIHCKSLCNPDQATSALTKRRVIQLISKVFDPLGILSLVIIPAKIFIQDLWKNGLNWDSQLPPLLSQRWTSIFKELCRLSEITIPRFVPTSNNPELHIFVDASKQAYGAVAYVRYNDTISSPSVHFLCSKARVAPVKKVTIPRLELIAAVMGCRLAAFVSQCIPSLKNNISIWSDSQIVLHWIKNTNLKQEIFVKNRITTIRSFHYAFAYCPTADNPADLCTRGSSTAELKTNATWWHGPHWLREVRSQWPINSINTTAIKALQTQSESTALKIQVTPLDQPTPYGIDLHRYNSLEKLLHVTAYCTRFVNHLRGERKVFASSIVAEELVHSKEMWIKWLQLSMFHEEISLLQRKSSNPLIRELHLQLTNGILLCYGRFQNANIKASCLNPILLPKHHYFSNLVIMHYHVRLMHQGVRHTVTALRQQVKSVLRKCLICKIWNGPSFSSPPIPPLPISRLTQAPSFSYTGCDFAGPVYVFDGETFSKSWICIFTCAVTRAVHLELVGDMSTGTFILALKRFVSRRGVPVLIISDNARTFKLTKSVMERLWLHTLTESDTVSYIAHQGIKWQFNVERAPWWGGFYERLVGLVKRTLEKATGKIKMSSIQLTTLLTEIEAILNSRPLTYVYSDSDAGRPLTPNSFLLSSYTGIPTLLIDPDHDFNQVPAAELLSKLQRSQKTLDYYWSLWHSEYLHQLREYHSQWQKKSKSVNHIPAIGDVVLVKEEGQKRGNWKLGIIQKLYPGSDGNVRSVQVKCKSSILNRSISHLYPLKLNTPIPTESTDSTYDKQGSNRPQRHAAQKAAAAIREQLKDSADHEQS